MQTFSIRNPHQKGNIDDPDASLFIHPFQLHQGSALEHADAIWHRFHVESSATHREFELHSQAPLIDDGTNACSFIAVAICDTFLNNCKNQDQCLSWNDMAGTAENIIRKLPRKIGKLRDSSQTYGACEAKRVLESNGLLEQQYDFLEACVSGSGVLAGAGRDEIFKALGNISADVKNQVGVYTCVPYAFTVGLYNDSFFLVHSHSVGEELGGNGNGIPVATPDRSSHSCRLIIQWILKRLWLSGVDHKMPQSLAWLSVQRQGMLRYLYPFLVFKSRFREALNSISQLSKNFPKRFYGVQRNSSIGSSVARHACLFG